MNHYDNLKNPPKDALKEISFGKLKGKSDINPQWRIEAMTREFGSCGIGWRFEICNTSTQELKDGQLMVFMLVALYIKEENEWSQPVYGYGGDFIIEKDKNGIHGNDEAYKMALTDALGNAMKCLGVAGDVYRGQYGKYTRRDEQVQKPVAKPESKQQQNQAPTQMIEKKVSDSQINLLIQKAISKNLTESDVLAIANYKFGVSKLSELKFVQFTELVNKMSELWDEFLEQGNKAV